MLTLQVGRYRVLALHDIIHNVHVHKGLGDDTNFPVVVGHITSLSITPISGH